MPLEDFTSRWPQNVPGRFYVSNQCLDCGLCRDVTSAIFERDNVDGNSYVLKQPATEDEVHLALEAKEGCPCDAIHDDGDQFDWHAIPAQPDAGQIPHTPPEPKMKSPCQHCQGESAF